jgi:drug/metabolite transporter (DMT)-like permease
MLVNPVAWSGAPLALVSAILFGASTPVAKLLLGDGLSPWLLAGLLYLGSGIGLAVVHLVAHALGRGSREAPLRRADLPWLGLVVLTGGVVGPALLMLGLTTTPASSASLLLNLEGLATMLIAWVTFRESVDQRLLAGAASILAGAVVLSWQGGPEGFGFGALAIAGACLAWGIDNNLTRKLSAADPVQIVLSGASAKLLQHLARQRPQGGARGGAAVCDPRQKGACARSSTRWRAGQPLRSRARSRSGGP